jgi:hypothetical protein
MKCGIEPIILARSNNHQATHYEGWKACHYASSPVAKPQVLLDRGTHLHLAGMLVPLGGTLRSFDPGLFRVSPSCPRHACFQKGFRMGSRVSMGQSD